MKKNFCGVANDTAVLPQEKFLCDVPLWRLFVEVFRTKADSKNRGWRCEFFGKTMRGAALVCAYTENEELYAVLTDAVRDMLTMAADSRTGKAADSLFSLPADAIPEPTEIAEGVPCLVRLRITPKAGEPYSLVDYASAGRDWKTMIAAWLPTEE